MKINLLCFLSIFSCNFCNSQNGWTIYNTTNSPIPENSVHCIAFDNNGLKWIGTDYGLATFDDTNWTIYNTSNSGLPDNSIRSLAVDKNNTIWIGTFLGGLTKFDGTNWTVYNTSNSGLPENFVKSIAFDTSGNKWIATIIGLVEFDDTNWTVYDMSNSVFTLSDNIAVITIDSNNVFKIGTVNGGYLKIDNTGWTLYTIPNGSGIPDNTQLGVATDINGVEWLATPSNGLVAHPGGNTWLTFTATMPSSAATCLVTLPNPDRLWIGTYDVGVVKKEGINFNYYDPSNSPMPDNYIQCIEKDANGIIWIGTQIGGLVRLDESQLTGIPSVSSIPQPVIFPQPVKDNLTVFYPYSKLKSIDVMDISGASQSVYFNEASADFYKANVNTLSAGIYFLRIKTSDGKMLTKKIIKIG